jgi:hypothetical protein
MHIDIHIPSVINLKSPKIFQRITLVYVEVSSAFLRPFISFMK